MAKGDDIQERLIKLAVAVMHLCDEVPKSLPTSPIAGQLMRSATAASANYAEARGAESRNDFVHKLGITYKELNESENWLRLLMEGMVLPEPGYVPSMKNAGSSAALSQQAGERQCYEV